MNSVILGVDISKRTFDVALFINSKVKTKKFDNNSKGFSSLKEWLKGKEALTAHICMEATGCYGTKLAQYLYDNNFKVSVVNPARIKGFSMSQLSRVKTDYNGLKKLNKKIVRFAWKEVRIEKIT